jgi:hypothetical protein
LLFIDEALYTPGGEPETNCTSNDGVLTRIPVISSLYPPFVTIVSDLFSNFILLSCKGVRSMLKGGYYSPYPLMEWKELLLICFSK